MGLAGFCAAMSALMTSVLFGLQNQWGVFMHLFGGWWGSDCVFCWEGNVRRTKFCRNIYPLPFEAQKNTLVPKATYMLYHKKHVGVEQGVASHRPDSKPSFPTDPLCVWTSYSTCQRTVMASFDNCCKKINTNYRPMLRRNSQRITVIL